MNRNAFINTSLTPQGRPRYEIVYNNTLLDPSEVAKSIRYDFYVDADPMKNIPFNCNYVADAIESDWKYGNTKFILTFGIMHNINHENTRKRIQFAGYWL